MSSDENITSVVESRFIAMIESELSDDEDRQLAKKLLRLALSYRKDEIEQVIINDMEEL